MALDFGPIIYNEEEKNRAVNPHTILHCRRFNELSFSILAEN